MHHSFDLNNIALHIDLRTNELTAELGDIRQTYTLGEFVADFDVPASKIPMVYLMLSARVKFMNHALTLAA